MTGRSYGKITYRAPRPGEARLTPGGSRTVRGTWHIDAHPHVATRLRQIFPNAQQVRGGVVTVSDTLDAARDLEMVLTRWRLDMDTATAAIYEERRTAFRQREEAVHEVLSGRGRNFGVREPIRPPMPYTEQGCKVPFQLQAAQLAVATGRMLLGDDLGFGKTYSAILALNTDGALPALVVCQAHLPDQWAEEIAKTLPWLRVHVIKQRAYYPIFPGSAPPSPAAAEQAELDLGLDAANIGAAPLVEAPDVLVISYSKLDAWAPYLAGFVKTVIFDEIQELRHSGTAKHTAAGTLTDVSHRAMGLSNTPVYNYGIEAFAIINVLYPGALGTEEEFKREWCYQSSNGKWLLLNPGAFGAYLRERGLLLSRTYEDIGSVGRDGKWHAIPRPQVVPVVQNVDYDTDVIERAITDAAEMARLVLSRGYDPSGERFRAAGQLDAKIRAATGVAKAVPVAAYVRMLLQEKERVVLFGWHRAVYDLWLEHLSGFNPVLYTGSESPKQKRASKARFCGGDSRLLIISNRSGTGLDGLQHHCEDVVFGELDWSPMVHRQGIGRVARGLRRSNLVTAHYCVSDGGSDPLMEELLSLKRNQAEPIMTSDGDLFEEPPVDPDRVRQLAERVMQQLGQPVPA